MSAVGLRATSTPAIDERTFSALLDAALAMARERGGSWSDISEGDPGVVLLELFAFLTDNLVHRVNHLPAVARRQFVELLGANVAPPAAAVVTLRFSRPGTGASSDAVVPAGTAVHAADPSGGAPVVFLTDRPLTLAAGVTDAEVDAHHCRQISAEVIGVSTGEAGQSMRLQHAPVVLATGHELDLVIGVAATSDELEGRPEAISVDGRPFVLWRVVSTFAGVDPSERVVRVDRASGTVTFAPSVRRPSPDGGLVMPATPMGAVPAAGREVRAWYRCGGGISGNVAAGTLTGCEVGVEGLQVTNPARATGGRDGETVDDAIRRAPEQFHEPRRAVTADDFEALARREAGISRARAITASEYWAHASAGTVEVRLVPDVAGGEPPSRSDLLDAQHEQIRTRVGATVSLAQPLGVRSVPCWADYKEVAVSVRVVVGRTEDPDAVRRRVEHRLRVALSPVPVEGNTHGWPFGRALRASNVYDIALREPGVRYADSIEMHLTEAPDGVVRALAADHFQADTWYGAEGNRLFRSQNGGIGWELVHTFGTSAATDVITRIVTSSHEPGMLAVIVTASDGRSSRLYVSSDCGSSWPAQPLLGFSWDRDDAIQAIRDACWLPAGAADDLLVATDRGLYRMTLEDPAPRPWVVDPADADRGCWAVTTSTSDDRNIDVLVSLHTKGGVWRGDLGQDATFRNIGLSGVDVRRLVVERRGLRRFLWAPAFAVGDDPGTGCHRAELSADPATAPQWTHLGRGWNGGICHDLAFLGDRVVAASEFNGVLALDTSTADAAWQAPSVRSSGLPLQENRRFHPVVAVQAAHGVALAATGRGVFRTADGTSFKATARRVLTDLVTIPASWLFCSGNHSVHVAVEDR
jgi:hypothetical protein